MAVSIAPLLYLVQHPGRDVQQSAAPHAPYKQQIRQALMRVKGCALFIEFGFWKAFLVLDAFCSLKCIAFVLCVGLDNEVLAMWQSGPDRLFCA
eukprot:1160498-Pelagomonas_calceolata.AAC.7